MTSAVDWASVESQWSVYRLHPNVRACVAAVHWVRSTACMDDYATKPSVLHVEYDWYVTLPPPPPTPKREREKKKISVQDMIVFWDAFMSSNLERYCTQCLVYVCNAIAVSAIGRGKWLMIEASGQSFSLQQLTKSDSVSVCQWFTQRMDFPFWLVLTIF